MPWGSGFCLVPFVPGIPGLDGAALRISVVSCGLAPRRSLSHVAAQHHHESPIVSPHGAGGHPWGQGPLCHPVPPAFAAPCVWPGHPRLSRGTGINVKSRQSNEPKIQRQNKLLIAQAGSAQQKPVTGHLWGLCKALNLWGAGAPS